MTPVEFETQIKRLSFFASKSWTTADVGDRTSWLGEMRRIFEFKDGYLFSRAIDKTIDGHTKPVLPMPGEVLAHYEGCRVATGSGECAHAKTRAVKSWRTDQAMLDECVACSAVKWAGDPWVNVKYRR